MNDKLAIIQARTGSSRLPNKILLKILDKELLLLLIDRVIASNLIDHIIIATTINKDDDAIEKLVENYHHKVSIFRGDENDVLDRYFQSALHYKKDKKDLDIIRITSDCPLIDPKIIDLHIEEFNRRKVDYLSSRIKKRTWPHGLEMEICTFDALQTTWKNAREKYEREHVTPYIYKSHPEKFKLFEYSYKKDISNHRFTIDYAEDYTFLQAIFEKLYPKNPLFTLDDILQLLDNEPDLLRINANRVNPEV